MAADADNLDEQLLEAAEAGHVEIIRNLLQDPKLQIDWPDPRDGCTSLHRACANGFTEVVAVLTAGMARIDASANDGTNPVWIAAANGRTGVLRLLAVDAADATLRHRLDGRSPVCAAAQMGQDEALHWLLQSGGFSDAQAADCSGWSPIQYACQRGHINVLKELLNAGADPNLSRRLTKIVDCRLLTRQPHGPNNDTSSEPPGSAIPWQKSESAELSAGLENDSWSPLYVAAYYGQTSAVQRLLTAGADVFSTSESAAATLQAAALTGRLETVRLLLAHIGSCVDEVELSEIAAPAVWASSCLGHADALLLCLAVCRCRDLDPMLSAPSAPNSLTDVAQRLYLIQQLALKQQNTVQADPETLRPSSIQLSRSLHVTLRRGGFLRRRAAAQAALASALELLLRRRLDRSRRQSGIHVVGSFAEGWGCSVTCLNGNIEADSDIDVTTVQPTRMFHLQGSCVCNDEDRSRGEFVAHSNGHVTCKGFASNPSLPYGGCPLRAAVDKVDAFQCCCYPPLRIFERGHKSCLPSDVLRSLATIIQTLPPCHLVPATLPSCQRPADFNGSHLRLSTTFLERHLLRNLTTVQGQTYVTLKYLLKRVLSARVTGLKSYHAKSILFYMLDELPPESWKADALVDLVRQGLQRLLDCLKKTSGNECMMHFFLPQTVVYLKRNYSDRSLIEQEVQNQLQHLDTTLCQFICCIRPCDTLMHFHPFILHPILSNNVLSDHPCRLLEVHEVYDAVPKLLKMLAHEGCSQDVLVLCLRTLLSLPESTRTTKHCLTVLTYLKFGMNEDAKAAIRGSLNWTVSKGIFCPRDARKVSHEWIRLSMQRTDWLNKFGLRLDRRPTLTFLPDPICQWFPCGISFYMHQYYVNFHALLRCLTLQILGEEMDKELASEWFREVIECPDSDAQELLTVLKFCSDRPLLVRLIHKHRRVICDLHETLSAVVELFARDPDLSSLSANQTIDGVLVELESAKSL